MSDMGAVMKEILPWISVAVFLITYIIINATNSRRPEKNFGSIGLIIGVVVGALIGVTHLVRMGVCLPLAAAVGLLIGSYVENKQK